MGAAPLTVSDLVFSPQANHNFSHILTELKRSNLSITNRLRSVKEDAAFVADVADAFKRPLVANERCGSWYISPGVKGASAYFKSTDGHTGQWKFSLRRLNLHLLKIIGENDGCIIVDSTRRGKRMPDALSKTVPIWCCVLNHALFPDKGELELYTPPNVVSRSEHAQMQARIVDFVRSFKELGIDVESLEQQVQKPLRPIWITQESQLVSMNEVFEDFHPVICCTSSRRVLGGEMSEGGYIQGAGDDTENWAHGLTPPVFWKHEEELLATPEADLPDLIESLVRTESAYDAPSSERQVAPNIYVGPLSADQGTLPYACTIVLYPQVTSQDSWIKGATRLEVGIGKHKVASRNLRPALPFICEFVQKRLSEAHDEVTGTAEGQRKKVLILCESGKDFCIGVALALMCHCFDVKGNFSLEPAESGINKSGIKIRLGHIMAAFPEANPSRATLQSVNSFLMG